MKLINKNSANTVYFTLTEKSTLASPYFLFKFQSVDSDQVVYFNATDISLNTDRFNKFIITESGTTNYSAGTVSLTVGEWNYYAYESTAQTLSVSATTGAILEQGLVYVSGSSSTTYTYTGSDDTEKVIYFN